MSDKENDLIDGEAPEDEEDDRDARKRFEDSSEEEEDEDEFEKDDFIVDGDDDESNEGEDEEDEVKVSSKRSRRDHKRKRHRKNDFDDELDEEDLLMLKERGIDLGNRKKLKRLKKHTEDSGGDDDIRNLGDDDNYGDFGRERGVVDEDVDDIEDDDDFIDDGGRARRRRKRKDVGGVSSDAVRAARSVFGDFRDVKSEYQPVNRSRKDQKGEDNESGDDSEVKGSRRRRKSASDGSGDDSKSGDDIDGLSAGDDGDRSGDESRMKRGRMLKHAPRVTAEDIAAAAVVTSKMSLGSTSLLSAEDTAVIETDVPERLQKHLVNRETVTTQEISLESEWIYKHAFETDPVYSSCFEKDKVVRKISQALVYIHNDNQDVPFIAQYRKDYIAPELLYPCGGDPGGHSNGFGVVPPSQMPHPKGFNAVRYPGFSDTFSYEHRLGVDPGYDDGFADWTPLWTVFDWDKKWADMLTHRTAVLDLISSCRKKGVPKIISDKALELVSACASDVQLSDMERHIRLATEAALALRGRDDVGSLERVDHDAIQDEETTSTVTRKRPNSRRDQYFDSHRKGYGLLSAKFGITSSEFADNVEGALLYGEGYQVHLPRDAEASPLDMAELIQKDLQDALNDEDKAKDRGFAVDSDAQRILKASKFLLAREFLSEPRVVQVAREMLDLAGVMVTAEVTDIGMSAVGETHALRGFVHIKDKPISAFANTTDFAFVQKASDRGYCNISFRFESSKEERLKKVLKDAATVSVASSALVMEWNEERANLVAEVSEGLLRRLKQEAAEMLSKATEECLRVRVFHSASRRLLQGPCKPSSSEDGAPRVMAVVVTHEGDEDPDPAQVARDSELTKQSAGAKPFRRPYGARCTFVNLDQNGAFLNSEEVFGKWLTRNAVEKRPPEALVKRIQAYLMMSKPEIIVVGLASGGKEAVRLRGDLLEIVADLIPQGKTDFMFGKDLAKRMAGMGALQEPRWDPDTQQNVEDERWVILQKHVISVPDEVSRVHAITSAASVALPQDGMTMLEKRGIALGRLAQFPLSVYAGIATDSDAASRLEFNRLHFALRPEHRVEALQRALSRSVCIMGVDLNRLLIVPHMQPMLTFVGGLGPRKAGALIRKIEQTLGESEDDAPALPSRKHLVVGHYLGRCVFMSAAGFLRVRDPSLHPGGSTKAAIKLRDDELNRKPRGRRGSNRDDDEPFSFFEPLDDSRIHPENYNVAVKIADEALRDENGDLKPELIPPGIQNVSARVIPVVLRNPEGLTQLDLEKYAAHLEKLGRGLLHETIKMVSSEFQFPFKDTRVPLRTPHVEAEFYLATGADIASFRVGSEVTASDCMVVRTEAGIKCRLPFKLRGFIRRANFSENEIPGRELTAAVPTGSDLAARIVSFKYEAFECELSCKPSVLKNPTKISTYVPAYDEDDSYILAYPQRNNPFDDTARSSYRARSRKSRVPGVTGHDYFHEFDNARAQDHLKNAPPGEFVIRPSRSDKGVEKFVFTAKFADMEKPDKGVLNIAFTVKNLGGKEEDVRYVIANEEFSSVDELLELFLLRLVENMSEVVRHPKFVSGTEEEISAKVKQAKIAEPKRIPYFIGLSEKKQLRLVLSYIPGKTTVQTETISIVPDGFQLRQRLQPSLPALFAWFKKNYKNSPNALGGQAKRSGAPHGPMPGQGIASRAVATPLRDDMPPALPTQTRGQQGPISIPGISATVYGSQPPPPPPPPPTTNPVSYLQGPKISPAPSAPYGQGMSYDAASTGLALHGAGRPAWGHPPQDPPQSSFRQEPYGQLPQASHPRGPPGRGQGPPRPPVGRGGPLDEAASRRGQMPVPAWKKAQQQSVPQ